MAKTTWYSRPLYRSQNDRIASGLLGGLAEYFGINSALLRLIFVILTAFSGVVPGVLAYIVGIIVVPLKQN